jgi:4-aminobutyrate aminotransferase
MGGLTFRADLAEKIPEASQPNTFAGNAVTAAATMTNLEIMTENERELLNRVALVGKETMERLQEGSKQTRVIGDVRGRGLMIGIELVEDKETKEPLNGGSVGKIVMGLLNRGIIMVPCGRYGNVLRFMPSLTITKAYIEKATDILLELAEGT